MPTCTRTIVLGLAALAALQSGLAIAGAEDRDGNPIIEERAAVEQANPLGVKPVDADALDGRRGGTDVLNDMLLKVSSRATAPATSLQGATSSPTVRSRAWWVCRSWCRTPATVC